VPAFAYSSASGTLDTGLATTPTVVSNNDGTGSESVNGTDLLAYVRNPTTPQAPFNANISLNLSVTDPSEVGVAGNGTINTTTPAAFNGTGSGIAFDSGNAFRYGRLRLSNAFGSELLDLPIPAEAQYWNGTVFVTNTADSCTVITATNIAMGNYLSNLSACETAIAISGRLSAGKSNLKLVKPGAGNHGSVDLTVNLGTGASGQTCVAPLPATQQATVAANLSYLQGKWTGTSYNQNPRARATFGVYKNANEFIYMREMY
jgi:MSHA biogenesis protein MshQ